MYYTPPLSFIQSTCGIPDFLHVIRRSMENSADPDQLASQ